MNVENVECNIKLTQQNEKGPYQAFFHEFFNEFSEPESTVDFLDERDNHF